MLKRIQTRQLRLGMYVQELCASWMSHPFWRGSFVLRDPEDIQRILDCGVAEAWIDTDKGLDVEGGRSEAEAEAEIDVALTRAGADAGVQQARVPFDAEVRRAARVCAESKQALVSMFRELRMGKAIRAESAFPLVEKLYSSVERHPGALISIARLKNADEYTYMHSVAVGALMIALARNLKLDERQVRDAGFAGLLHDVGKALTPQEILNKPGKLTDSEFALVKVHPAQGHKLLLEGKDIPDAALEVCLQHHEKADGSGYPQGLPAAQIGLLSKMSAVCDVYDAVTSDRPYKKGWDPGEAVRKMASWAGHFETRVFHAFVRSVGIYPIGSLVRMHSGRIGVIVDQAESLLRPKVKVFYSTKSRSRLLPEVIDLASPACGDEIAANEDPAKWRFPDLDDLWRNSAAA